MYLAKQLTYLWRGTEKDFCYSYVLPKCALGAVVEACFTGVQQYLAVPFTPSTEEARKKKTRLKFVWQFIVFSLVSSMGEVSGL